MSGKGQSSGYLGQCLFLLFFFPERSKSVDRGLVQLSSWKEGRELVLGQDWAFAPEGSQ